jgi:ABC-type molybdenum transport system ATPase subunit/photorepair protein PhrA
MLHRLRYSTDYATVLSASRLRLVVLVFRGQMKHLEVLLLDEQLLTGTIPTEM